MKKTCIFFLMILCFTTKSRAQCLAGGITFNTQTQIDDFTTDHPGCTQILGSVFINGNTITNLNGLLGITSIGGTLTILLNPALTNITGLSGLTTIGGGLTIRGNDALVNLSALAALISIGGSIDIAYNAMMSSIAGLSGISGLVGGNLHIEAVPVTSLAGLAGITSVSGFLAIRGTSITNLSELSGISSIGGALNISYNNSMTSITPLSGITGAVNGELDITGNSILTSLAGLEGITSVSGYLAIRGNNITNMAALSNITSVGGAMDISYNTALTNITALSGITGPLGGQLDITGNSALTSLSSLAGITAIAGFLRVRGNAISSLSGLENIDATTITDLFLEINSSLSLCEVSSICNYLAANPATASIFGNAANCISEDAVRAACGLAPLPIELYSFTVKKLGNFNCLEWQTAVEDQASHFDVECSFDGMKFNKIGETSALGKAAAYEYIDNHAYNSTTYYRLKMNDLDGRFQYSDMVAVFNGAEVFSVTSFPNPFQDQLWIQLADVNHATDYTLEITDVLGRVMYSLNIEKNLTGQTQFIQTDAFSNGIYFMKISNGQEHIVRQLLKTN